MKTRRITEADETFGSNHSESIGYCRSGHFTCLLPSEMDGEKRRSHSQRRGRQEEYRCELDNGLHRYENANLELKSNLNNRSRSCEVSKAVHHSRRIEKSLTLRAWATDALERQ